MHLALRIIVLCPLAGVTFRLQRGRHELVAPSKESPDSIAFDFDVRVAPGDDDLHPRLTGPFAQGTPAARFIYINSGKQAGQSESCWDRRAKVPLAGITSAMIDEALATPGATIEAEIAGTGRDGGPACASVPLARTWHVVKP